MALKKKSKVSAQFNMSSLTDIIFLLLIFFMLTSSLVSPNALNLKLPSSSKSKVTSNPSKIDHVRITRSGSFYFNRRKVSKKQLAQSFKNLKRKKGKRASITIAPDRNTPTQHVVYIMDLALQYDVNGILTAQNR